TRRQATAASARAPRSAITTRMASASRMPRSSEGSSRSAFRRPTNPFGSVPRRTVTSRRPDWMRGRKQYRYHPKWRELRDQNKYEHIIQFAAALPALRDRVAADMKLEGLPREKVLATIVGLLEKTLIRVGNAEYAEKNKSYGLTTMRRKHVAIGRGVLRFEFRQVGEAMETAGRGQAHCLDRQAL